MRIVRTMVALAGAVGAVLVGLGVSAPGAGATERPAVVAALDSYHFGTYYTLEACRYFGDSLVAGGAWRYYNCIYEWRSGQPQGYYYLYMYN